MFAIINCTDQAGLKSYAESIGIEIWYPLRRVLSHTGKGQYKKTVLKEVPVFRGFAFVKRSDFPRLRRRTPEKFRVSAYAFDFLGNIVCVDIKELIRMQELVNERWKLHAMMAMPEAAEEAAPEFNPGQQVKVQVEPFKDQIGVVQKGGTNATVRLKIGKMYVNLPFEWLLPL